MELLYTGKFFIHLTEIVLILKARWEIVCCCYQIGFEQGEEVSFLLPLWQHTLKAHRL